MDFDLDGKLASIDVPRGKALQPLFEAVVNSFQAIEMAGRGRGGKIEIIVQREPRLDGLDGCGRIDGFVIVDDGVGFTDDNLASFFTAYSRHKLKLGGKGIGRFTFLKVFDRTEVDSHFGVNGHMVSRSFSLPAMQQRPTDEPIKSAANSNRTSVELLGMKEPWRSSCPDRAEILALNLIAHCIPYFLNPACPRLELIDDGERIDLNEFFRSNFQKQANARAFSVDGHKFTLTGFRLWHNRAESKHKLIYAAHYRAVVTETLTKYLPSIGDHHLDGDDGRKFVYVGFVEGEYLNQHTNPERLRFNIPSGDDDDAGVLTGMPSFKAIRNGAIDAAKEDLAPYLEHIADLVERKVRRFVAKAPELRPMLRYLPKFVHEIPADATDARINEVLRKHQFEEEQHIRRDGQKLFKQLKTEGLRPPDYETRLNDWLERSNELGKSALARYVAHRKVMLQFLEASLRKDRASGRHKLEDVVHRIIYPMQTTSDHVNYDQQNLWIIDERLAFHQFLVSDKRLDQLKHELSTDSQMRPDLAVFQETLSFKQDPDVLESLVIVEFKQPGRDDYDPKDNPIEQAFNLIDRIREGRIEKDGRPIRVRSKSIPAWAYIVCDITDTLRRTARRRGLQDTIDGEGLYQYFPDPRVYIEIISYDKLLTDAKKRNRVLFESLNLPSS